MPLQRNLMALEPGNIPTAAQLQYVLQPALVFAPGPSTCGSFDKMALVIFSDSEKLLSLLVLNSLDDSEFLDINDKVGLLYSVGKILGSSRRIFLSQISFFFRE